MLSRRGHEQQEGTTRIAVDVTFLKMSRPPRSLPASLPAGARIERVVAPAISLYRSLYDGVGADYCWWLRRVVPDAELADIMAQDGWALHVLYESDRPGGFYELERRGHDVNLSYFGLLPHAIGKGLGRAMLAAAVHDAWARRPVCVRVNTCNADHPRALGLYQAAGFEKVRTIREVWDIPDALGLEIPFDLRVNKP